MNINLNLPNHETELKKAEDILLEYEKKFNQHVIQCTITNNEFINEYENIIMILDYIGNLSKPALNVRNELEEQYFKSYRRTPELAKKLWIEHFKTINKPYTKLKDRCFDLLDEYDMFYQRIYNKKPPNWSCK